VVLLLTVIEKKNYNCLFTPFSVTAWPFAIISLIVNLIAVRMQFLPVSVRANFFILVNLILIWIVGSIMYHLSSRPSIRGSFHEVFAQFKQFKPFLIVLSWMVIIGVAIRIQKILGEEGIQFIGNSKFENMMIVGYAAHLVQLGKVLLILLVLSIWKSPKKLLDYVTIVGLVIVIMSVMVKYHLIWVILIIFFIKNIDLPYQKQLKKIIIISSLVVLIFVFNFVVLFLSWKTLSVTNPEMWNFIFSWLFNYIMSGPIVLDRWIDLAFSKPWWSLFIVPINVINVVIGDPERLNAVRFVSGGWTRIAPELFSNVGTSFGVYYLIGGIPFTFLSTILISVMSYLTFIWSYTTKNPIVIFLTALLLTLGILSFFVQFFTLLSLYEVIFFYTILVSLFSFFIKLKGR
jgi:hypothetical protein